MRFAPALFLLLASSASAQVVRFDTSLGNIDVELLPQAAPLTVANFLKYVERQSYDNSFFHRSVRDFVIQGGGFQWVNNTPREIQSDGPVQNEYRLSNTRGTIAMAKLGNDPNSATTQWFFNLGNNASNLNTQNGGFTVFGRITDGAGLAVMDRIAALPAINAGSPFDQLPVRNFTGASLTQANLVMVNSIRLLENRPAIGENGIVSAGAYGGFRYAAPGSWIEIYGTNLAANTRMWSEFPDGRAPTALDDVRVTIDGKFAFISYISPGQINVQVPADVALDTNVPVVVTRGAQATAPVSLAIRRFAPGLLAPPQMKQGERQFAWVGGTPTVLTFYGVGFGPVTGAEVAGSRAPATSTVNANVQFSINDVPAEVQYAGLAPELVGLYQFNVRLPAGVTPGEARLRVTVNGEAIPQELWIAVP